MAAKKYTEEEALELDGQCPKHQRVLEMRVVKDEELGAKRTLFTCPDCVTEDEGGQTCSTCGANIKWATTPAGKKMPMDLGTTTARLENGEWVKVHITHFITCPDAKQHRKTEEPQGSGQPPERRTADQPPRTGAPWDKCKRCGTATEYSLSDQKPRRDGKPGFVRFENWPCPDNCGYWWKIEGSDYKPQWKDKS